jgi:hypothetical protein
MSNKRILLQRSICAFLSCGFFLIIPNTLANATTDCGSVARNLQSELLSYSGKSDAGSKMLGVLSSELGMHPECRSAINKLMMWNGGGAQKGEPFPSPASKDSFIHKLGPISWWWNLIYNKLFGSNLLLFLLFGWEIFLGGITACIQIPLAILGAVFPVFGRMAIALFRLVARLRKPKDY